MIHKYTIDKSTWSDGPWMIESDFLAWIDEKSLVPCIMERNTDGTWLAMAGLTPTSKYFYLSPKILKTLIKSTIPITHAKFNELYSSQFHPPFKYWWIGFSFNRNIDYIPHKVEEVSTTQFPSVEDRQTKVKNIHYRTIDFTQEKISELAAQIIIL